MDSTSMSPADFSAMMGNNANGFGGNGAWWIIILFLFFMNGGWGNRNGELNQYATAASQQDILFGQKFSDLDNKIDRLGNGICDSTFALNNTIHSAQDTLGGAIVSEGRAIQTQLGNMQMQSAQQTCAITSAVHDEGERTRALIQTNEIQALRDKVAALEADSRMCGVVRYPLATTYAAANPFCNCNCGGNI